MLTNRPGAIPLLLLLALVPASVAWWRGRALACMADDPALSERLASTRQRNTLSIAFAIAAQVVVSPLHAAGTIPLTIVAFLVASYPLRCALYSETWSLITYLWFVGRLVFALWGFWILLALLPVLAWHAGRSEWIAGLLIAIVLVVWNVKFADVIRHCLRSRPIVDPALLARFNGMAERCGLPCPRFERVDLRGGSVANAIALPSLRRSAVLFTEPLLARLAFDEAGAICAHELAHLEHFNAARLRRLNLVTYSLVVSGALLSPLARLSGLTSPLLPLIVWASAFLGAAAWRARDRQRNETASDVRAAAITGDPESLARALAKLYTFARIPRRVGSRVERQSTHPSLARRIREIRRAAGAVPVPLADNATIAAASGGSSVTFQRNALRWSEGPAATHILAYPHLAELRVEAGGTGATTLVAVECGGRSWRMPLADGDVARTQALLDVVDERLADPPHAASPSRWTLHAARYWAGAGVLIALLFGQFAVVIAGMLAVVQPSASMLAAAGVAGLSAAALIVRDCTVDACDLPLWSAALLAAGSLVLLLAARKAPPESASRRSAILVACLGLSAALSLAYMLMPGVHPSLVSQSARTVPGAVVLLLALAAALGGSPARRLRYAAFPVALGAAAIAAAGTTAFLERFGGDPMLVPAEPLVWRDMEDRPFTEFAVAPSAMEVRLSPAGRLVAILLEPDAADDSTPTTFQIGAAGGPLVPIVADDLAFIDDERILVLVRVEGCLELREVSVAAPDMPVTRQKLPRVLGAQLSFKAATRTWRVLGWDVRRRIVRAEGTLESLRVDETHWPAPKSIDGWFAAVATSGTDAVLVETRYDAVALAGGVVARWTGLFRLPVSESRLWRVGRAGNAELGVSWLGPHCVSDALGDDRLVCSAYDGTGTRVVAVDPSSGRIAALGSVPGRFFARGAGSGWLTGWQKSSAVALRLGAREAWRLAHRPGEWVAGLTAGEQVLAALSSSGNASVVRLYAIQRDSPGN